MRFFHISDLHIGKQLYSYSLLPDQRAVLHEITERAKEPCNNMGCCGREKPPELIDFYHLPVMVLR